MNMGWKGSQCLENTICIQLRSLVLFLFMYVPEFSFSFYSVSFFASILLVSFQDEVCKEEPDGYRIRISGRE